MRNGPSSDLLAKAAVLAARASGRVLLRHFGSKLKVSEKKGAGLVTEVDLASEETAVRILRRAFPGWGFLTEESGVHDPGRDGRWIIDPLDGTTNYVHGFPMFCVSIAAEWRGRLVAGVIHHPVLDETYVAALGKGSRLNGRPIRVSRTRRLEDSLLTTGFTYRKERWLRSEMRAFESLSRVARAVRRPGSAALDLAYTARGVFDGFWERRLSPWDIAAGALLVQEAGGKVTDLQGNPFSLEQPALLASNRILHPGLLRNIPADRNPI